MAAPGPILPSLAGKVALVTGAAGGIGRAAALAFAPPGRGSSSPTWRRAAAKRPSARLPREAEPRDSSPPT